MPKKAHQKKKDFQRNCLKNVRKGLINNAEGQWVSASSSSRMHEMMRHGYKIY